MEALIYSLKRVLDVNDIHGYFQGHRSYGSYKLLIIIQISAIESLKKSSKLLSNASNKKIYETVNTLIVHNKLHYGKIINRRLLNSKIMYLVRRAKISLLPVK